MSDIEIDYTKLSDHELLLLVVQRLETLGKIDKWVNGNGIPGAKFQLWVLWAVFVGVLVKVF